MSNAFVTFGRRGLTMSLVLLSLLSPRVEAFPPAPYYTLYGTVRDQTGQIVAVDGAAVILLKGSTEAARAPITGVVDLDKNYELAVRIDALKSSTSLYTAAAVPAQGQFSLAVLIDGQRYYPIEVQGSLTAGKGGERVRLDLTLGEDTDRDELPDAWEQWQLYQAGLFPETGAWDLSKLSRNGDFDGDGQSDWLEYIAGTFASDAEEKFDLQIKGKSAAAVQFEFFSITGKTYTIEASEDLKTWRRVSFSTGATLAQASAATSDLSHRATAVGRLLASTMTSPGMPNQHYRLSVR